MTLTTLGQRTCELRLDGPCFYIEMRPRNSTLIAIGLEDVVVVDHVAKYKETSLGLTAEGEWTQIVKFEINDVLMIFAGGAMVTQCRPSSHDMPTILVVGDPVFFERCTFRLFYEKFPEEKNTPAFFPTASVK